MLHLEDLLDEPEFKNEALKEEATGWDAHEFIVSTHAGVDEMLPEKTKVPHDWYAEGYERDVHGRVIIG